MPTFSLILRAPPFKVISKAGKPTSVLNIEEKKISSMMVLLKMKETAEAYLGTTLSSLSLPFSKTLNGRPQRMPEPSRECTVSESSMRAAAIAYVFDKKVTNERDIFIFDLFEELTMYRSLLLRSGFSK